MNALLETLSDLLDVARGRIVATAGPAQRSRFIVVAGLATLVFCSLWGVAAGSTSAALAGANAVKVPMVILFSMLAAIPAGVVAQRLSGSPDSIRDLLLSFTGSVFAGALVAAVLAPVVAVYYLTSAWAGPYLGMGSVFVAIAVAAIMFFRHAIRGVPAGSQSSALVPRLVLAIVTLAVLPQMIALVSPILPETTVFDSGVDAVVELG